MAKEFLDGADVGTIFEEMRGEGVPERLAGGALVDPGPEDCRADGSLNRGLVQVRAPGSGADLGREA